MLKYNPSIYPIRITISSHKTTEKIKESAVFDMGLQAIYERFLSSPNAAVLADNATLQYITTLKSFSQKNAIVVHLDNQTRNVVKKKSEKVISAVEGLTSIAIIVETVLQFVANGGTYLPGVDEFILDKVVTLPIVSISSIGCHWLILTDTFRSLRPG